MRLVGMGEQLWEQEALLERDRRMDRRNPAPSGDDSSGPRWAASPVPQALQPHALQGQRLGDTTQLWLTPGTAENPEGVLCQSWGLCGMGWGSINYGQNYGV